VASTINAILILNVLRKQIFFDFNLFVL